MRRAFLLVLLLCPTALAQGVVDELIVVALDPRTAPAERVRTLDRLSRMEGGLDRLAEKGLDPALDPEVIHAVVERLLKPDHDYARYVGRIIPLLPDERHWKVRQRIQSLGEHPTDGKALLEECGRLAQQGATPAVRKAALLALAMIPYRRALELILVTGRNDPALAEDALAALRPVLGADTLAGAAAVLAAHPNDSHWDLVQRRLAELEKTVAKSDEEKRQIIRTAPLEKVLELLGEERLGTRRAASERLRQLVAKNDLKEPAKAAAPVYVAFVRERDLKEAADLATLANLVETLRFFTKSGKDSPLWKVVEEKTLRAELATLAGWAGAGPEHQRLGAAAVRLLRIVDNEGSALAGFARNFSQPAVRREAIQYLGTLATVEDRRVYVALTLANLLKAGEKDAGVRTQILSTLTQPTVPANTDALAAIEVLLTRGARPALGDAETKDCITILTQASGADVARALQVLYAVARDDEKDTVRRLAVEGLLARARREEDAKQKEILQQLKGLVLDAKRPESGRAAVAETLGKHGTRLAKATLNEILAQADLPEAVKAAALDAKLALAERLASGPDAGASAGADLKIALQILEEEAARDPARTSKLADTIVRACDAAGLPAGGARYLQAHLYAQRQDKDQKRVRELYEEAVARIAKDAPPVDLHRALLEEYKTLLADKSDQKSLTALLECTRALAGLAKGEKTRAAQLYLEAAKCAIALEDAAAAERCIEDAKATGGLAGQLTEVHKKLQADLDRLKKSGGS